VLYSFAAGGDGKMPDAPLIARNGKIYGTTTAGTLPTPGAPWTETGGAGMVYRILP
jgi:hypothetical protein